MIERIETGLDDELAAANVGAGFTVSKMQDDFVDAPAIRRGAIKPHLLGARTERLREKGWAANEELDGLLSWRPAI